jgi:hypothetical protein
LQERPVPAFEKRDLFPKKGHDNAAIVLVGSEKGVGLLL